MIRNVENTHFAVIKNSQKPFVSFPLLTRAGQDAVLTPEAARSGALADCVCLAWVDRISFAVYLMPPQKYRVEPHDSAFFVFCGSSRKVTAILSHENGEFLVDLAAALVDAGGGLDVDELHTILTGIAAELCYCVDFFDGDRAPVLGGAWFFDRLEPEPGGEFGGEAGIFVDYVAITRALSDNCFSPIGCVYRSDFDAEGRIRPTNFAVNCEGSLRYDLDEFDESLSIALEDYRARRYVYKSQIKKPKRSTRVRELLWNSYPHICGICGKQIDSFDEMHVDHIIPLSRGGKDILANLQLTHSKCNLEKGAAVPECDDELEEADDDARC